MNTDTARRLAPVHSGQQVMVTHSVCLAHPAAGRKIKQRMENTTLRNPYNYGLAINEVKSLLFSNNLQHLVLMMIAGMIFLGFQLSQCSLISDFGAGKSLRSVKRSVDCLIVGQSTEYRLTGRRPGGQWWRGLYAFFTPFPEFLFLFTLDVSGETT